MFRPAWAAGLALVCILAGCVSAPGAVKPASVGASASGLKAAFTPLQIIDKVRAGGEPVIQITPKGTILVAAHPGWTHTRYPPSANLLIPASGQSYMWRSTDGGKTFAPVGLPMAPNGMGPRGLGQGMSDPDFAIDSKGRVYFTDLEALAAASVSWSDDDGQTWLEGNDIASTYGPIDRNWIATNGTDVYFMGNYGGDEKVLESTNGGLTWMQVGSSPCEGQFLTRPADGAILIGCEEGIAVSTDGGAHFDKRDVPGAKSYARAMTPPGLDRAGNVYAAWTDANGTYLAGSPDLGKTWWPTIQLNNNGTNVWPYIVAGDAGKVAVVWYHTDDPAGPDNAKGPWNVEGAFVMGADSKAPQVTLTDVAGPIFNGKMCQRGTACQTDPNAETGDRRLGDFFEAAIDNDGHLNVVFAVALDDSISHPGFAKETSGPILLTNATASK